MWFISWHTHTYTHTHTHTHTHTQGRKRCSLWFYHAICDLFHGLEAKSATVLATWLVACVFVPKLSGKCMSEQFVLYYHSRNTISDRQLVFFLVPKQTFYWGFSITAHREHFWRTGTTHWWLHKLVSGLRLTRPEKQRHYFTVFIYEKSRNYGTP